MGSTSSFVTLPHYVSALYRYEADTRQPPQSSASKSSQSSSSSDEKVAPSPEEQRVHNLHQRGRGRFGTVRTSFTGLQNVTDNLPPRKRLLGE